MSFSAGVSQTDVTPNRPVWMAGYGDRDRRSEGIYQHLRAGALYLRGTNDEALLITVDLIGYDLAYAAQAKQRIALATGMLPRQIVLTATHTHCGPHFYPMIMNGEPEWEYAEWLCQRFIDIAIGARKNAVPAQLAFTRTRSEFGINRRLTKNGATKMAPNPDGPIDRDLDTMWLSDTSGKLLSTLTVYGCHPTSLAGYLIGGDYPGFLCRELEEKTGAPAFFGTGCAGDVRPWYNPGEKKFERPQMHAVKMAGQTMAEEILAKQNEKETVRSECLAISDGFHLLPFADRPDFDFLNHVITSEGGQRQRWAEHLQSVLHKGPLPASCPHEIQVLELNPQFRMVFLGGEVLSEIGLHVKELFSPATTITVGYSNGLIGYIPSKNAYPHGGYEVNGSHHYFMLPAPYTDKAEDHLINETQRITNLLGHS